MRGSGGCGTRWQLRPRGDAGIAAAYTSLRSRIHADFVKVAETQIAKGGARTDVSVEDLADTLWVLASPHQDELLATEAGWSEKRYHTWLARVVVEGVLERRKSRPLRGVHISEYQITRP